MIIIIHGPLLNNKHTSLAHYKNYIPFIQFTHGKLMVMNEIGSHNEL